MSQEMKDLVAAAIKQEWAAFEQNHPNLAAVIDQTLLVEGAAAALRDDPAYAEAIGQATEIGTAVQTVGALVQEFVGKWLKQMI